MEEWRKMSYAIGLIGMWLFADAWYSLVLYADNHESFWKCNSIRWIRLVLGVVLMGIGAIR